MHFIIGFPTVQLPWLYRDACLIAKMLGVRYLWIDALCIVQKKGGDWHTEAPKMATIYGGAFITVAFVDGTDLRTAAAVSDGVFVPGLLSNTVAKEDMTFPFLDDRDDFRSVYLWLDETENFPARLAGELDGRGWTFQERLLSRRILNVTAKGIIWDCIHHNASDWRPLGFLSDSSPRRRCAVFGDAWWEDYTSRDFSDCGDRMVAFSGVTRQIETVLRDDVCILGIWRDDALRSLAWFVDPDGKILIEEPPVVAPSWSWMSVSYPIRYHLPHSSARQDDRSFGYMETVCPDKANLGCSGRPNVVQGLQR
ncbi:hypothetical protein QBC34DRAFT_311557 [Podospora aff. communis PSN243]|uniref:Heterokaryon incompatibility domain-containing protein n=1 Tax=Podospora aff. communis PSN243 TaxID=3040156 RepID=A0AAV9G714_9PEZI|nr:hypothetical protein QBC34DRAFT_311557 [Podospora aff. communis PSN243]